MDKITLGDIIAIVDKCIFTITDLREEEDQAETVYWDADNDFYDSPNAKALMEREVLFITTKKNHINIILK